MRDFAETSGVRVEALPPAGMVTLRGDLSDPRLGDALNAVGLALPDRRRIAAGSAGSTVWMSPDELLVVCGEGEDRGLAARLSEALAGVHHLAAAVGDARVRFAIDGKGARIALAKIAPADMAAFEIGEVRRTRVAQVAAAFWMTGPDAFELVCFRSVADYAGKLLASAAGNVEGIALP
ncbi:MAG: sarcosine oxidase subunit gamma [Rhodobacteraceae bacterium]|nr:sarcosine oxidase subunit gamma [Paracoccaceae bacterium]